MAAPERPTCLAHTVALAFVGTLVLTALIATAPAAARGAPRTEAATPTPLRMAITLQYGRQRVSVAGVSLGSTTAAPYGTTISSRLRAALGPWGRCERTSGVPAFTRLTWPRIGLFIDFRSLTGAPACGQKIYGYTGAVVLDGKASRGWIVHTERGDLRVGMRSTKISARLKSTSQFSTDPEPSTALYWPGQDPCRPRAARFPHLLSSALSEWEFGGRVRSIHSFLTLSEGVDC